jgi:hypothetical protein
VGRRSIGLEERPRRVLEYVRFETHREQLKAICRELLDLTKTFPGQQRKYAWDCSPYVSSMLLAKMRDDLAALLAVTTAGNTSACYSIGRSLFESIADFLLIAGGSGIRVSRQRALEFLSFADIENKRMPMVFNDVGTKHESGKKLTAREPAFRPEAVKEAIRVLKQDIPDPKLRQRVRQVLNKWDTTSCPKNGHWSGLTLKERVELISAGQSKNSYLLLSVHTFVVEANGFVHTSAASQYLRGIGVVSSDVGLIETISLYGKAIEPIHYRPIAVSLLLWPDVLKAYDRRTGGERQEQIGSWIRKLNGLLASSLDPDSFRPVRQGRSYRADRKNLGIK